MDDYEKHYRAGLDDGMRVGIAMGRFYEKHHITDMCQYDEAFTIEDMLEETNCCRNCTFSSCPNCGKSPV